MSQENTFTAIRVIESRRHTQSWITGISPRKILRVAIVLTMSVLCWLGVGCFAVEMFQLVGR